MKTVNEKAGRVKTKGKNAFTGPMNIVKEKAGS
jgi:hypothetical protein